LIREARPDELDQVRELFREYGEWVGNPICFKRFAAEIAALPGEYSPLLVAVESGELAGCAALRSIGDGIAEMKRLYVRPAFRGRSLGHQLLERVIARAKELHFHVLRLDTLPVMESAIALYRAKGFREIPPYGDNPEGALCFELGL
jgi:N-acetylglutamate synthase-like GNAT family acetyltransferase